MDELEMKQMKKHLALQLEKYVTIIKNEFKDFIPGDTLKFLNCITNYEDIIQIEETGTITCFVRNGKVYFPLLAYKVLNALKRVPGFGSVPNHTVYNKETIIINNNTFNTYIVHAFLKGLSSLEFYEEMLLHEAMHLCGFDGNIAFREGIVELKTRELAKKYNLKTNSCGYPKEVKLVYKLQEIFGSNLITRLGIRMLNTERRMIIYENLGSDGVDFFEKVIHMMEEEFQTKYYKYAFSFTGITAPFKKAKKYNGIDYTNVYKIIKEFCDKQGRKISNANKITQSRK